VTFRRIVLWSSLAWLVLISALHASLNLDFFRKKTVGERGLKISYLPVT
jgi:hypothetical protein